MGLVTAVRDIGRLREIYSVLARHGFGQFAQRLGWIGPKQPGGATADEQEGGTPKRIAALSLAERMRLVVMDLGPSFVKLGQIASTRPDLLPAEWIVELKKLQDEVSPLPFEDIRAMIESSLGAPVEDIFEQFDETPLAAASIAQVHRAQLKHDGHAVEVVVKV
jgi:ubiquinone biosynthesis protein